MKCFESLKIEHMLAKRCNMYQLLNFTLHEEVHATKLIHQSVKYLKHVATAILVWYYLPSIYETSNI